MFFLTISINSSTLNHCTYIIPALRTTKIYQNFCYQWSMNSGVVRVNNEMLSSITPIKLYSSTNVCSELVYIVTTRHTNHCIHVIDIFITVIYIFTFHVRYILGFFYSSKNISHVRCIISIQKAQ